MSIVSARTDNYGDPSKVLLDSFGGRRDKLDMIIKILYIAQSSQRGIEKSAITKIADMGYFYLLLEKEFIYPYEEVGILTPNGYELLECSCKPTEKGEKLLKLYRNIIQKYFT